ncbi:collagen-binding domain-containing protein [Anaerocolumna aminovalerica]|uniref:Choice-of-anchor A domain-containing protein n=1 Tax=Anaerocolumna aminovalerica TaxID=1527 RepID=A0A1I5IJ06_9FIRM|nr:collagen-binding domain-containing protein [Anaerocolumna aminovalerica]SFO60598.1 choice-of-anchor A domain-containing protein [Anaerocolumna aminovalerica]
MDNVNRINNQTNVGLPYDNIRWFDIEGQPFGAASQYNAFILQDANNIVDVTGNMAVGRNFSSPRGLTVGFGREGRPTEYTANGVRFLVGGNTAIRGPLVVRGHVMGGGSFNVAKGSTYLIGKDGTPNQLEELRFLYEAPGGSPYWAPTDKGNHYLISSYDVPRYIPARRVGANLQAFFQAARESLMNMKNCIMNLPENGTVVDNIHEWILRGTNPQQNVFLIDARPNGVLNKGIRAEVPEGSTVIVKIRTGNHAHLQYGLIGEERRADRTLYVFEDATDIHMEVPAAIWGSILAPQAMFHAHPTGGQVSGNVAFNSFAVSAGSGFEFHALPFRGRVVCRGLAPTPPPRPTPPPAPQPTPPPPPRPTPPPAPQPTPPPAPQPTPPPCPECPAPRPCPEPPPCPAPRPCPEPPPCPECPAPRPCPEPPPCPECPAPRPCPAPPPCPACPPPRPCPEPLPCPECPAPRPCPPCPECPKPRPCPPCPECPEATREIELIPFPIQMPCPEPPPCPPCPPPRPCPPCPPCPPCEECLIEAGIIYGCIWGCNCCKCHEWEIKLYELFDNTKTLLYCDTIANCGCFEFEVPYDGCYILEICPASHYKNAEKCKPIVTLKNVGVRNFMLE